MRKRIDYPMGSISSGTMRPEDLIPTFCDQLRWLAVHPECSTVSAKTRKAHKALFTEIMDKTDDPEYYGSENADWDLDLLFDALSEYAAPYFYFGSHPGDGADYGFWLDESWDEDFTTIESLLQYTAEERHGIQWSVKVSDLADVPAWFRGEVAEVNDHGNVTLYVKTSRGLREVWAVV